MNLSTGVGEGSLYTEIQARFKRMLVATELCFMGSRTVFDIEIVQQRLLGNECKTFHFAMLYFAASFNAEESADLSTLFDVGGIIGKFRLHGDAL